MIGDIFWAKTEGTIPHPHVIIEEFDSYNFKVCMITTNQKKISMPGNVLLELGEANLSQKSIVEVYKQFTVQKDDLGDYIGTLSSSRVKEIIEGYEFVARSFLHK
jgi:mRNA interferase MazF